MCVRIVRTWKNLHHCRIAAVVGWLREQVSVRPSACRVLASALIRKRKLLIFRVLTLFAFFTEKFLATDRRFLLKGGAMFRKSVFSAVLLVVLCPLAIASDNPPKKNKIETLRQQGYSVKTITPIFSQLLTFSFPKGFKPVFEDAKGAQYIQESVLEGESTKKWSQMVTVTGAKGLASNPNITPQAFANRIAGGFKNACPTSFSGNGLGAIKLGNYDAFASVISCGVANPAGELYSESMLLIVIKGESDYYTIQWAERGSASTSPIKFDDAKWTDRFQKLTPIKLCPIVPGESAPYPSCVNRT